MVYLKIAEELNPQKVPARWYCDNSAERWWKLNTFQVLNRRNIKWRPIIKLSPTISGKVKSWSTKWHQVLKCSEESWKNDFFAESMCCDRGEDDWSSFPLAPKSLADCCLKGAARVLPSQGQDSQSCPCQENFSHHLTAPCPLSTEHSHSHLLVRVHTIVLPPPRDVGVLRQVWQ